VKLVAIKTRGASRLGAVEGSRVADLAALAPENAAFASARAFLEAGDAAIRAARRAIKGADQSSFRRLSEVRLGAPIPHPRTIYAMAGNYRSHIEEGGGKADPKKETVPLIFFKPSTSIIGPDEAIRMPGPICTQVDWEAELGVVIGKPTRAVAVADALDHVAGYVNFNDVSGRSLTIDIPRKESSSRDFFDWLQGKWFDTFSAMGPYLTLKDEIPDPQKLKVQLWVNGQIKQDANTRDMIFSAAEAVHYISQFVTLLPGDVIATGTPAGVGATTGTYLAVGDTVEMEITGLGRLRNPVAEPAARSGSSPRFLV